MKIRLSCYDYPVHTINMASSFARGCLTHRTGGYASLRWRQFERMRLSFYLPVGIEASKTPAPSGVGTTGALVYETDLALSYTSNYFVHSTLIEKVVGDGQASQFEWSAT